MGVCLALREPIIRLLFGEIEPEVMASASVYFRISAFSYPVIGVYSCCAALFRTMGNSKVSMYSGLLANVVNIGAKRAVYLRDGHGRRRRGAGQPALAAGPRWRCCWCC